MFLLKVSIIFYVYLAMDLVTACQTSLEITCLTRKSKRKTNMLGNILTLMHNVNWYLERAHPPVPTCHPVQGFGVPLQEEKNMAARPNTCPGQMVLHVVRRSGV